MPRERLLEYPEKFKILNLFGKKLYQVWGFMAVQRIHSDENRLQTGMIIDPGVFFVKRKISGT